MSRFSVETSLKNPRQPNLTSDFTGNWPTVFPKETIGIDRNGIIVTDKKILTPDDIEIVPGALEAIRTLRVKGYKVFIFFNEPLVGEGRLTQQDVEVQWQRMMEIFGQAGILSIEGMLYSTTTFKQDIYAFPNTGMLKKAEKESKQKFKGGYFVGNKINSLKAGFAAGAKPILIKTGDYEPAITKIETFANRDLKNKTSIFNTLLDFANSLK